LNRRQPTRELSARFGSRDKALMCAWLAAGKKASDLVIMDVSALTTIADYFVLCNGRSDRQVQSIAQTIEEEMAKIGVRPLSLEGYQRGQWVLIDLNDVVVHVFYQPVREFYDLDRLWADAPKVEPPSGPSPAGQG